MYRASADLTKAYIQISVSNNANGTFNHLQTNLGEHAQCRISSQAFYTAQGCILLHLATTKQALVLEQADRPHGLKP